MSEENDPLDSVVQSDLKEIKNKLQNLEKTINETKDKKQKFITPVMATIIVAILGIFGSVITNSIQKSAAIELERKKFEYEIYKKVQETNDLKVAARLLDFYILHGIIKGIQGQFVKSLDEGDIDKLPLFDDISRPDYPIQAAPATESGPLKIVDHFLVGQNTSYIPSPNHGGTFAEGDLDAIVMNATSSDALDATVKTLSNPQIRASAHIVIGRDGTIVQMVPFNTIAWHTGMSQYNGRTGWNKYSIAIELVNALKLTKSGNEFRAWWGNTYPDNEVTFRTHKNESSPAYWHTYTDKQIAVAEEICKLLIKTYNIKMILGHDDISAGRKIDPGPAFPMADFREKILGGKI